MHRRTCVSTTARQLVVAEIQDQSDKLYRDHEDAKRHIRQTVVADSRLDELDKAVQAERARVASLIKKAVAPLIKPYEKERERLSKLRERALFANIKELRPMYDELKRTRQ